MTTPSKAQLERAKEVAEAIEKQSYSGIYLADAVAIIAAALADESEAAAMDTKSLAFALHALECQVIQASVGFGIWPYEKSESMKETLKEVASALMTTGETK